MSARILRKKLNPAFAEASRHPPLVGRRGRQTLPADNSQTNGCSETGGAAIETSEGDAPNECLNFCLEATFEVKIRLKINKCFQLFATDTGISTAAFPNCPKIPIYKWREKSQVESDARLWWTIWNWLDSDSGDNSGDSILTQLQALAFLNWLNSDLTQLLNFLKWTNSILTHWITFESTMARNW